MKTLTDFVLARIADDEAAVKREPDCIAPQFGGPFEAMTDDIHSGRGDYYLTVDPARVLAECAAKRRIVGDSTLNYNGGHPGLSIHGARILGLLALPYADHPDFREEWRP